MSSFTSFTLNLNTKSSLHTGQRQCWHTQRTRGPRRPFLTGTQKLSKSQAWFSQSQSRTPQLRGIQNQSLRLSLNLPTRFVLFPPGKAGNRTAVKTEEERSPVPLPRRLSLSPPCPVRTRRCSAYLRPVRMVSTDATAHGLTCPGNTAERVGETPRRRPGHSSCTGPRTFHVLAGTEWPNDWFSETELLRSCISLAFTNVNAGRCI